MTSITLGHFHLHALAARRIPVQRRHKGVPREFITSTAWTLRLYHFGQWSTASAQPAASFRTAGVSRDWRAARPIVSKQHR